MSSQLGFDGMPAKLVRVTPAKLNTLTLCKRRYRMAYLDRPTPPRGGAWAHATLSAAVHSALRALFELPASGRNGDAAAALLHRHWRGEGFADAEQALACGRSLRRRCRTVELHHLPSGTVARYRHDEDSLGAHRRRAEDAAAWISAASDTVATGGDPDEVFPPTVGRHCSWCDFRRSCPEGAAAATQLRPWDLLDSS
ncbi:MAG: PD-(D/E)XK nuclease family protein [Sciscionella sp.]